MNKSFIKSAGTLLLIATALFAFAQKQAPQNWFHLDAKKDKIAGVSSQKAYDELLKGKKSTQVIVAVIDGGTEVNHEDLKQVIWVNKGEIPDNNIDDDKNGYTDDVNGWNFIGGAEKNVAEDNLEVTRLYKKLHGKYGNADTNALEGSEKDNYNYYKKIKSDYLKGSAKYTNMYNLYSSLVEGLRAIQKGVNKDVITQEELKAYPASTKNELMAQNAILQNMKRQKKTSLNITNTANEIEKGREQFDKFVNYFYNVDFESRDVVGDNYENAFERYYGNNKVSAPNGEHGTHVAGIIAAIRNNGVGMDGVADNVKIMVLRVVPDGDERDKDVANAIKYAVDNGATIINMSFGKPYSPYKEAVDDAIKYALAKDVLLVHAAGNDNKNTDIEGNFPTKKADGYNADNWLEIGASSWEKKKKTPATFSNYGKVNVDVFAPGVDIYSCIPESKYASYDGTSMAAPVTAGVAAVLRSYYPTLKVAQIKNIIKNSAVPVKGKVYIPGTTKKVKMTELCQTGGIVNLYQAVLMAETLVGK